MVSPTAALKRLARQDAKPEHHEAFAEQLGPRASHRTVCILQASNVERGLDKAIQCVLNLPADSQLLDAGDFYSAFAQKIELGYALKIYGKKTRHNLNTMRNLRNAFAHAKVPLTFDTPEVAAVCNTFEQLPMVPPPKNPHHESQFARALLSPRDRFEYTARVLGHNLGWWALEPVQGIDPNALKPEIEHDPAWEIYRRKPPLP